MLYSQQDYKSRHSVTQENALDYIDKKTYLQWAMTQFDIQGKTVF